ncbi:hypothetical protein ACFC1T_08780 [Kitasatospora sp. NPDC056076]|uniref:hypothetical protein n=1 Tax=Kitasatospora sp. NPDC056076 TaxID=3345703 RepID=UPI0035D7AFC4
MNHATNPRLAALNSERERLLRSLVLAPAGSTSHDLMLKKVNKLSVEIDTLESSTPRTRPSWPLRRWGTVLVVVAAVLQFAVPTTRGTLMAAGLFGLVGVCLVLYRPSKD